ISQLPYGKALYTYEGKEPGDLKFNKGDIIILRRKVDENWYHGELNGNHGFFPASYIQCIKPLPQAPPQGKALYDFEIKDKDQDKDCLTFTKDEILTVIRRVDDNWAEGMLGDKIGIFPILYVELNESAKQLIEMDKTCLAAASGCDVPLPSDTNMARHIDGKKNAKKRHSFTALSMTHKSSQAMHNRHSMEISAPVLISSSDPRAAARIGDLTHLSSSAPAQVSLSVYAVLVLSCNPSPCTTFSEFTFTVAQRYTASKEKMNWAQPPEPRFQDSSSIGTATVAGPRTSAIVGDQGTPTKVQLPLNIYLALYAYKPQKNDELELRKGEMYRVIEKCQDGWFKGTSLRTGMSGVFPGNYVTPVSRFQLLKKNEKKFPKFRCGREGRGGILLDPRIVGGDRNGYPGNNWVKGSPVVPITAPQTHPQQQTASPQMNNCMRYSAQQMVSQTRSAMQMAHSSAQVPERPTATVSPLRTQSSPSRLPATAVRPHSMASPQHVHQAPAQVIPGAQCARPVIPLTSAAAAITPPNVSAANLNGEVGNGPISSLVTASPTNTSCKAEERKNEKGKEKKGGLLKLLAGASTKKKSRSPPSVSPTPDPQAVAEGSLQGAVGPELSSLSSHGRAGSCPIESEMQGAMGMEPLHRKTGSLDLNFSIPSPARQPLSSMAAIRPEPKPLPRERYRVVVPYPPQSEAEIELKEGDVVFVHKKREDGWYKGTLQRNGRTGLFPGSFVESF
uniref:RING-type E3 ubiquitin transferase n=1 Tax=Pelodiscus sinensis TaxID=13735 RepID=K7FVF6_PELSI